MVVKQLKCWPKKVKLYGRLKKKKIHRDISNNNSYAEVYQKHIDCGYGHKVMFYYVDK